MADGTSCLRRPGCHSLGASAKQLALLVAAAARGIGQGLQGQQAPVGRESPLEEVQCLLALLGTSSMGTAVQALRDKGEPQLAKRLQRLSKCRNLAAHPDVTLKADIEAVVVSVKADDDPGAVQTSSILPRRKLMRRISDESSTGTSCSGSGGSGRSDADTQASKAEAYGNEAASGPVYGVETQMVVLEKKSAAAGSGTTAPGADVSGISPKRAPSRGSSKPAEACKSGSAQGHVVAKEKQSGDQLLDDSLRFIEKMVILEVASNDEKALLLQLKGQLLMVFFLHHSWVGDGEHVEVPWMGVFPHCWWKKGS